MKLNFVCAHCGAEHEIEAARLRHDGEYICLDCALSYHTRCDYCDKYELKAEIQQAATGPYECRRYVCRTCAEHSRFEECEDCGHLVDTHYTSFRTVDGDREVCPICRYENYRSCNHCHKVFHIDDLTWNDEEEVYYCEECYKKYSVIRSYSYKPRSKYKTSTDWFHTDESITELLMGVENEIDDGRDPYDTANRICEAHEDIYAKHDGSLDSGFEIVSHPCTLDYHINQLGWDGICEIALSKGYKSHAARTCGLHIHVGKRQLGETEEERNETIAKIVVLVDRHWEFFKRFSRRRESQLINWAQRPNLELGSWKYSESQLVNKALSTRNRGRYQAVNLTNGHTIEFRLFNGTLKASTIYATLQMVSNICLYAKEYSMERVMRSNWEDVANFNRYAELQAYIKGRGLHETENPEWYYLNKEVINEAPGGFRPNDIVKIVNAEGIGVGELCHMIGEYARIAYIKAPGFDAMCIGLNFGVEKRWTHSLDGRLEEPTGYWVYPENIEFAERPASTEDDWLLF